jgi:hypothetical protein
MKYVFDIDGTICSLTNGDYENAKPYINRVKIINKLYNAGHQVIFQTARGMGRSGNDQQVAYELFYELTEKQLAKWGVKYHQLFLGKPSGDIYIDDKACRDDVWFSLGEEILDGTD